VAKLSAVISSADLIFSSMSVSVPSPKLEATPVHLILEISDWVVDGKVEYSALVSDLKKMVTGISGSFP